MYKKLNVEKEFMPWIDKNNLTYSQLKYQKKLLKTKKYSIGKNCFISQRATIVKSKVKIGDNSIICANAIIRGAKITIGKDCSINSNAILQGNLIIGDNVRIAPGVTIIAENHGYKNINKNIKDQDNTSKGIKINNDVWIGANVVIVDGVEVGSHVIIGAGSIVTKNIPDYKIVVGNPAKVIKDRIRDYFYDDICSFNNKLNNEITDIVNKKYIDGSYVDNTTGQPEVRALCDAIEILAMFNKQLEICNKDEVITKLQNYDINEINYEVLCVSYALESLNRSITKPILKVNEYKGEKLVEFIEKQSFVKNTWNAGHNIDCLSTAIFQNIKHCSLDYEFELQSLFDWLDNNTNSNGLWGDASSLEVVNGFYRLTRGTYCQFEKPLKNVEKIIDYVLLHSKNNEYFAPNKSNACNVLDVVHPLWLCKKQTNYRVDDCRRFMFKYLSLALENYNSSKGFSFTLKDKDNESLMGTEMWLSIIYIICDYLEIKDLLEYEPKGIHKLNYNS